MRDLLLLGALGLVGCTTAATIPVHGETAGHRCVAPSDHAFGGQLATSALGSDILRATHAAVLRWAPPGVMLTMDYREDRVTVRLGPDGKVTAVNCG